jgi:uncharacterized protein
MNCPLCHKPTVKEFDPFCSRYCKNKDLLSWLKEAYTIPVNNPEDEEKADLPVSVDDEEG